MFNICSICSAKFNLSQPSLAGWSVLWPTSSTIMPSCPRTVCLLPVKVQARQKLGRNCAFQCSWILTALLFFFFYYPTRLLIGAGNGCDGTINQLGGSVLECHRRSWHSHKTGTVSDPAAMASLFLSENNILSYINLISLFICMLRPFVFARPDQSLSMLAW